MKEAGILPFFAGIVVSDRYAGYFSGTWETFAGHQACTAHLIRDFEDCAETYPGSGWPQQAQRALRGLIRAWHAAREQGLPAIPGDIRQPLELEFRRAVTFGLSAVPRVPGPKNTVKQKPGREVLGFCKAREADVLRFAFDTSVWPTNDLASYCTSCGGWRVRGLARRCGLLRAGGFSVAVGSDILPWRAGAPGCAVGVAAA